jgi:hypothetical protein
MSDKRFWLLVSILVTTVGMNALVSLSAIVVNQSRITNLELENQANKAYNQAILISVEKSSRETSEKVVEALSGLTTVIEQRTVNELKQLELLEAIYLKLTGENHGE